MSDGRLGPGNPRAKKYKVGRKTYFTFYRTITGHAFTGAYTARFFPLHTQDQAACPCGEPTQTVEHVLRHCPLFAASRRSHLTTNRHPRSIPQLFSKPERALDVLRFLEETGTCSKPQAAWEPD